MGFKKIFSREELIGGSKTPKFYGAAWQDVNRAVIIYFPIPFNHIFSWVRNFWHWLKAGARNGVLDQAYWNGFRAASANTYHLRREFEEEIKHLMIANHNEIILSILKQVEEKAE